MKPARSAGGKAAPARSTGGKPALRGAASAGTGGSYSDHNKSWLKEVKKHDLFEEENDDDASEEDDEGEEDDDGEEGEEGEEAEEGEEDLEEDEGEDEDEGEEDEDSEDDDEEDDEDEEMDFERKARETMDRLTREAAENQEELQQQIASESVLPTEEEMEEEHSHPPDVSALRDRIKAVAEVLGDFGSRREPGRSRSDYMRVFSNDLALVYGYNAEMIELLLGLFSPAEALQFIETSETPRPVTIRTNSLKTRRRELAQALIARNVNLDPIAKWSKDGLQVYESAVPIGATPEYLAGHYMVQSASSFLPVLALQAQPGQRVLDMAASPGGKSSHIAAQMGNSGTLVANDFNKERLRALQANLSRLGVRNSIIMNADGREFPKLMGGFDRVLLDAPCTGLGVISKDPSVKAEKSYADVQRCAQLQRELLLAAIDSCVVDQPGGKEGKGGGIIVYSTCSIAVEENEAVVDYVLKSRAVKVVDTGLPFGVEGITRHRSKRFHSSLKLSRRFYPHTHNMDGFFVCKLRKYATALPTAAQAEEEEETGGVGTKKSAAKSSANVAGKGASTAKDASKSKGASSKRRATSDPSKAPGPLPTPGSERPGGGKHGDGQAKKRKEMEAADRAGKRRAGKRPRRE
eukprot:CAMPEP_0174695646 /NCGR_PEP_ID=MMETSP1094-20130205/1984_1 /TAXON_ID=156173 /ORGANISM="Chrysochromulina brevifilum, Strain UTEX LB 985" /LENGTH=634 /DNA_ID=CAMNT_0015892205 /DNA_START=64 /DNA_END=1968 /DNA_ORIENTATION=-